MSEPLVSVLIPAYKAQDVIGTAIKSVLEQTYLNWEIVVCIDGNFDDSYQVATDALLGVTRSSVFPTEHTGVAAKRNELISRARGDYVFFLDADDELRPDALRNLVDLALLDDSEIVLGRTLRVSSAKRYERDRVIKSGINSLRKASFAENPELVDSLGAANKLIASKIAKLNFFDPSLRVAEDQLFNIGCYLLAKRISTTKQFTYLWKMSSDAGAGSLSNQIAKGNVDLFCDQLKALIDGCLKIELVLGPDAAAISSLVERVVTVDLIPSQRNFPISNDPDAIRGYESLFHSMVSIEKYSLSSVALHALQELSIDLALRQVVCGFQQSKQINKVRAQVGHIAKINGTTINLNKTIKVNFASREVRVPRRHIQKISDLTMGRVTRLLLRPSLGIVVGLFASHQITSRWLIARKRQILRFIFSGMRTLYRTLPITENIVYVNNSGKISLDDVAIQEELTRRNVTNFQTVTLPISRLGLLSKSARLVATSKVVILSDYCSATYGYRRRKKQFVVQLWHASGSFKKFGLGAVSKKDSNTKRFELRAHMSYSHVVVSSRGVINDYVEAFGLNPNSALPLGRVSTDRLFAAQKDQEQLGKLRQNFNLTTSNKVLLFAPTFRGGPSERKTYWPNIDFLKLRNSLGSDWKIALRVHPVVQNVRLTDEEKDFILDFSHIDLASALGLSEHVTTDYSSIIFDAAATGKSFSLFTPDVQSYTEERGFYPELMELLPTPPCQNLQELSMAITQGSANEKRLAAFRKYYVENIDGQSTERISEFLAELFLSD